MKKQNHKRDTKLISEERDLWNPYHLDCLLITANNTKIKPCKTTYLRAFQMSNSSPSFALPFLSLHNNQTIKRGIKSTTFLRSVQEVTPFQASSVEPAVTKECLTLQKLKAKANPPRQVRRRLLIDYTTALYRTYFISQNFAPFWIVTNSRNSFPCSLPSKGSNLIWNPCLSSPQKTLSYVSI